VDEEVLLSFTATATDPDIPANALSYSLVGAPVGASIDPGSGAFSWTPTEAQGAGLYTFDVKVCDDGGPVLCDEEEITVTVNEVNLAPVLGAIGAKTVQWGDELTFTATATDSDIPANALSYSLGGAPSGASIDSSTGLFTWLPMSTQIGSHTFTVRVTDDGVPNLYDEESITVTVGKRPTYLIYTGATLGQYSDNVELSATLMDAGTGPLNGTSLSGKTINFALGTQTTDAETDSGGEAVAILQLLQPAATYTIDASFAGDDSYTVSSESNSFIIKHEDASVEFDKDNLVAVAVAQGSEASDPFELTVHIRETYDENDGGEPSGEPGAEPGDISLAYVSIILSPIGPGSPVEGSCTKSSTTVDGYNSRQPFICSFEKVPVNTYSVDVNVEREYYTGYGEDVMVVYDPGLGFATGGGWFYWPGSADEETGYPGDKTNFGFTMKYNKKSTNVKGSLLLIRHLPNGTIYRVKSNALYGLAIGNEDDGEAYGWASFSGKATYKEPGWLEPEGNHEFLVYVEDHNEPGSGADLFWIEVRDKNGDVIEIMSMDRPGNENTVAIQGGNLVVPH
jgi:hypothetical protein